MRNIVSSPATLAPYLYTNVTVPPQLLIKVYFVSIPGKDGTRRITSKTCCQKMLPKNLKTSRGWFLGPDLSMQAKKGPQKFHATVTLIA